MKITLNVWRQKDAKSQGRFVTYEAGDVNEDYDKEWLSDANWLHAPMIPAGARIKVLSYESSRRATVDVDKNPLFTHTNNLHSYDNCKCKSKRCVEIRRRTTKKWSMFTPKSYIETSNERDHREKVGNKKVRHKCSNIRHNFLSLLFIPNNLCDKS